MKYTLQIILMLLVLMSACVTTLDEEEVTGAPGTDGPLVFESDFLFNTSKTLSVRTNTSGLLFDLAYDDADGSTQYLGRFRNNGDKLSVKVPGYVQSLQYTAYNDIGESTVSSLSVDQEQVIVADAGKTAGRTNSDCIDHLYAVNGQKGFYKIDITTDEYVATSLPELPGGSIADALDQANNLVYINVNKTLYKYHIGTQQFEIAFTSNPFNGAYPRFEYKDNQFYMSNASTLYKVDATTNQVVKQYTIEGFINSNAGGDMAFAADGTLYMACFSGLYKFTAFDDVNDKATIVRISAENFPYQLTSMAIDRQDRIFVATNDASSRLIEISKEDGAYEIVKTFPHKINDLTAWKCEFTDDGATGSADGDNDGIPNEEDDDMDGDGVIDEKDSDVDGDGIPNAEDNDMDGDGTPNASDRDIDGDGVINPLDEFPEDPSAAAISYTPSKLGYGTLAFEDNWPAKGDFDFNDVIVRYKAASYVNGDNKAIRMTMELRLVAAGGVFNNGFGIEMPMLQQVIESVTGHNPPSGTFDARGLETGQSNPTIIVFSNALSELGGGTVINSDPEKPVRAVKTYQIEISFTELLPSSALADAPFNPFIFVNERERECHLRNGTPTDKADLSLFATNDDHSDPSTDRYYVTSENVPFGIDIIHNFRYPKEGARIDRAYLRFMDWGQSGGITFKDWYSDATGYRNSVNIYDSN